MTTRSAVGLTMISTTLIGSLGEEALRAIPQDQPAITQVDNTNFAFSKPQGSSFICWETKLDKVID